MSRVDDDRDEALAAARLAEARRAAENQKARRTADGNVFAAKVATNAQQGQVQQQDSAAKSAIAKLLEEADGTRAEGAVKEGERGQQGQVDQRGKEAAFKSRLGLGALTEKSEQGSRQETKGLAQSRGNDRALAGAQGQSRGLAQTADAKAGEGRGGDAKAGGKLAEKREASLRAGSSAEEAGAAGGADKAELMADADKGGGKGGGESKDQGSGNQAAASMRFNPALMAPPPVAKPKEATGSDRLRKVANELAQKIVERVRIGTNAQGKVEFQVDLRSDVLAGLSVKVSAHNGKIKAVFTGRDRDVLKMIEEQGEALKGALSARGLTLEEFKTEARS